MSRSFFNSFFWKSVNDKSPTLVSFLSWNIILIGHGAYVYGTSQSNVLITVQEKYTMSRSGYTEFMIIDDKGRHFNFITSYWYWIWDAVEKYHKLKVGDQVQCTIYGKRIPLLGVFPNIVRIAFAESGERGNREH
jgi:hypothetical protein